MSLGSFVQSLEANLTVCSPLSQRVATNMKSQTTDLSDAAFSMEVDFSNAMHAVLNVAISLRHSYSS
jgi:hypothetical protein